MLTIINLSIIIPHYNSWETLKKLLDSIPKIGNVEIIVIDDCSTKNSDLFSIADYKNVIFAKTPKNSGSGVARNIGLEKATGKYVLFADADDYFLEGFLDIVLPYTQSDLDCVFFKATSVYINTCETANRHIGQNRIIDSYFRFNDKFAENSLSFDLHAPWCKLIKLEFLKKNQIYFDEIFISQDTLFSIKVGLNMKNFSVSKDIIYCVTTNDFSETANKSFNTFHCQLIVSNERCKFLKNKLQKNDFNQVCSLVGTKTLLELIKRKYTLKEKIQVFKKLYNEDMLKPSLSVLLRKICRRFIK